MRNNDPGGIANDQDRQRALSRALTESEWTSTEEVGSVMSEMAEAGLLEWVGVSEDGQPGYRLTPEGKRYAERMVERYKGEEE